MPLKPFSLTSTLRRSSSASQPPTNTPCYWTTTVRSPRFRFSVTEPYPTGIIGALNDITSTKQTHIALIT